MSLADSVSLAHCVIRTFNISLVSDWRGLKVVGGGWKWLKLAGGGWKWLERVEVGWKWWVVVEGSSRWLEVVGGSWISKVCFSIGIITSSFHNLFALSHFYFVSTFGLFSALNNIWYDKNKNKNTNNNINKNNNNKSINRTRLTTNRTTTTTLSTTTPTLTMLATTPTKKGRFNISSSLHGLAKEFPSTQCLCCSS